MRIAPARTWRQLNKRLIALAVAAPEYRLNGFVYQFAREDVALVRDGERVGMVTGRYCQICGVFRNGSCPHIKGLSQTVTVVSTDASAGGTEDASTMPLDKLGGHLSTGFSAPAAGSLLRGNAPPIARGPRVSVQ